MKVHLTQYFLLLLLSWLTSQWIRIATLIRSPKNLFLYLKHSQQRIKLLVSCLAFLKFAFLTYVGLYFSDSNIAVYGLFYPITQKASSLFQAFQASLFQQKIKMLVSCLAYLVFDFLIYLAYT